HRLEREPLGLGEPALGPEDVGQRALALAERAAVLQRLEPADRLAQEVLGPRVVAALDGHLGQVQQVAARVEARSDLDEQPLRLLQRGLRLVELAELELEVAELGERDRARTDAAALLRQLERTLDQRPR